MCAQPSTQQGSGALTPSRQFSKSWSDPLKICTIKMAVGNYGRLFSEQKRDEIRKLISRSRMGILQKIAEKIAEIET
jgi:adenylate kinase